MRYLPLWQISDARNGFSKHESPHFQMIRNDALVDTSTTTDDPTLLSLVGDDTALDERASQLVILATEHGFPYY